jgi:hypothetical protein
VILKSRDKRDSPENWWIPPLKEWCLEPPVLAGTLSISFLDNPFLYTALSCTALLLAKLLFFPLNELKTVWTPGGEYRHTQGQNIKYFSVHTISIFGGIASVFINVPRSGRNMRVDYDWWKLHSENEGQAPGKVTFSQPTTYLFHCIAQTNI